MEHHLIHSLLQEPNCNYTALHSHLTRIQQHITQAQTHIQASIQADWPAFQQQWRTGYSLYHQSLHLQEQLHHLETKLDNPQDGLIPNLLSALRDREEIATQRSQSLQILKVVNSLSTAYQELLALSQLIYSNQLVTAVSTLPETKLALKPLYQSQTTSSLAKRAVYRIQELEEDLKQRLIDDVRSCITFADGKIQDSVLEVRSAVNARASSQQTNPFIPWSSAVDALETLSGECGSAASQLKKIATLLIEKIIKPLIESSSAFHPILIQRPSSDQSSCVLSFQQKVEGTRVDLYESLRLLFSTLQEKLLTSKSLQDKFSQLITPSLEAKLLNQVLDSKLPNSTRDEPRLSQLSQLLYETRLFAKWLQDHGWLAHSGENLLLEWCDQVQHQFLRKVATRVLEIARHEMITTQWESTVVSWEIVTEIEPPLPPSSPKENEHRALPNPSSFSKLTSQKLPDPESSKQPAGFKSLFRFVSGTSHHQLPPSDTISSAQPPQHPTKSNSSPDSKKFESVFDFGSTQPNSPKSFNHVQCSLMEQSIPSKVGSSSQPSSPLLTRNLSSPRLSPTRPVSTTELEPKAEEDVDWDMSGELEDPETLHPTASVHSLKLNQVAVVDEEIEEDAWGLDESNEEPTTLISTDVPLQTESAAGEEAANSQKFTNPSPSLPQQVADDGTEEEELDPDAWGFEEEEAPTLTEDDDQEVMRLRGGVGSSPVTSEVEDEDGWGWNEDTTTADIPTNQSTNNHPSGMKNDHLLNHSNDPHSVCLEQLTISKLAQKILHIVHQVVDDALRTESPEFPSESLRKSGEGLINLGFDILDLFRIIMYTYHSKSLESVPSLSVQFSNDCDWLSHQLSLIPKLSNHHQYQHQVKSSSQKLKSLANKVRKNQIANQKAALMDCLNEAEGFVQTSREDRFLACQRACKQVTHTLETLAQVWKPVMLKKEYLETLGELVETVLNRILKEIQDQSDIEEKDSKCLNILCQSLHPLANLFVLNNPTVSASSTSKNHDGVDIIDKEVIYRYVPSWFKFCFLSELLEASMADIMWMYEQGHLSEFSKLEIVCLIKALFADSLLRAHNIDLILH